MKPVRSLLMGLVAVAGLMCVAPSTTQADHFGYGFRYGGYRPYRYSYRTYHYAYRPSYYGSSFSYYAPPAYVYRAYSFATPYASPYAYRPNYSFRAYYGPSFPGYYGPGFYGGRGFYGTGFYGPSYRAYYGGFGPSLNPYYGGLYYGGRSSFYRGPGFGLYVY